MASARFAYINKGSLDRGKRNHDNHIKRKLYIRRKRTSVSPKKKHTPCFQFSFAQKFLFPFRKLGFRFHIISSFPFPAEWSETSYSVLISIYDYPCGTQHANIFLFPNKAKVHSLKYIRPPLVCIATIFSTFLTQRII
jgi:hypothetical protein